MLITNIKFPLSELERSAVLAIYEKKYNRQHHDINWAMHADPQLFSRDEIIYRDEYNSIYMCHSGIIPYQYYQYIQSIYHNILIYNSLSEAAKDILYD